ncbi:MAG TPA: glycoside hydrolase family 2 TIM barrel-domain containing protein, partial [Parasegetibacter sp.]
VKENSLNYISLNGLWKFHWVQDPRKRPTDFFRTDFDDTGWNNFPVPANWELNGFGLPIYVNTVYEFTGHAKKGAALNPPFDIPVDNNPVGSYRKKIIIPESWEGRQIFIHLGAVKSAFFIWVNGVKVGYSEDSKLAAEFDITSYVKTGENIVALQVYRWSDASYLECQDMWRISGIERDIYLYSTPRLSVGDFKVKALLDETYTNGVLDLNVRIENYKIDKQTFHSTPDKFSVRYELYDPLGNLQLTGSETAKVLGNFRADLKFQAKIANVYKWSAETPWLYKLYLTLMDSSGTVLEVIPHNIGFRSVEIKGNQFLINGKPVLLKGVNRHEHDPRTGHVISRELMLKDMEMMKKLNINAVRHSHYPPDPYWLELCDKYGLYVVEEANIESHGMGYDLDVSLGNNKKWRVPHLDRIQRMYERSKNFTSVVTWSLGNEGGNGVNFYEGYEWLKQNDYRPVQYERAEMDYNTDIIVPQYPDPDWLIKYALSNPQRPLIMSEYAHIMGNSLGNFREYWDAIEKYPSLQGGFIWEWVDQSIDTIRNGKRILAYGGDFPLEGPVDENISDNNFCVKGVVTAERKLTPMAVEIKHVHQYIKTRLTSQNTISVFNDQFFKPVNNVRLNWHLIENGKVVQKGFNTDIRIAPRDSLSVLLPINFNQKPGREYFLNVRWTLISDEPLV